MPPQVFRLVLLTIAIVASYFVARALLTPETFYQYGFYRGEALLEHASHEPVYAGRKACTECHEDIVKKLAVKEHKTLGCETCHGVSQGHVDNPDLKLVKIGDNSCLRCHENNGSRPAWMKQITVKDHFRGDKCTGCHLPHQPTEMP